jgi:hypothetical protein
MAIYFLQLFLPSVNPLHFSHLNSKINFLNICHMQLPIQFEKYVYTLGTNLCLGCHFLAHSHMQNCPSV